MYLSWEDTPDTPSKSGLKWWGILLIVLSVIFVLALGVIGFMKYKESKKTNQSRVVVFKVFSLIVCLYVYLYTAQCVHDTL